MKRKKGRRNVTTAESCQVEKCENYHELLITQTRNKNDLYYRNLLKETLKLELEDYSSDPEEEESSLCTTTNPSCSSVKTINKMFECSLCSKTFRYTQSLKVHGQNEHNLNALKCWACGSICGSFPRLKQHLWKEHSVQTPYKCNYCEDSFLRKVQRYKHIRKVHPQATPFACPHCDKSFRSNKTLFSHICVMHKINTRTFCQLCDFSCSTKSSLGPHMQAMHYDLRPFQCHSCDARFRNKTQRKCHKIATHDKLTPFECEVCPKKFGFSSSLKRHVREVHGNVSSFRCNYCDKTYRGRSGLQHHMLTRHNTAAKQCVESDDESDKIDSDTPHIKLETINFHGNHLRLECF